MPLSQSEALGRYPLARSQLTLGTRGKNRVEQFKKECGYVNTGQKRVCTTRKKQEKVTKKKTKCINRCEGSLEKNPQPAAKDHQLEQQCPVMIT